MCTKNFYNTIIRQDFISKFLVSNSLDIPKLDCVELFYTSDYNIVLPETYKTLKILLILEFVSGQKYKIICVGKKNEGRVLTYKYKYFITLRKKNIYRFLYQINSYNIGFELFRVFDLKKKKH